MSELGALTAPREIVKILYDYEVKDAPGMSVVAVEVLYPPGGCTPPHSHATATVVSTVTQGRIRSSMDGQPSIIYEVGDTFVELPESHHTLEVNDSSEEDAKLVAVLVVATEVVKRGYDGLLTLSHGTRGD